VTTEATRALIQSTLQEAAVTGDLAAAIRSRASDHLAIRLANGETGGIELAEASAREFYTAVPDASLALDAIVVEGDRAVVLFIMNGNHTGPIRGFAPTGKAMNVPMAMAFRIERDQIVELWYYANLYAPLLDTYREAHPDEAV
jgi:predicted ester cyclase